MQMVDESKETPVPRYYSVSDLAEMFHKNVQSIRRLIRTGELEAGALGGEYFVSEQQLQDSLTKGLQKKLKSPIT